MDALDTSRIMKEKKLKLLDVYDDLIHLKINELADERDDNKKIYIEACINELIEKLKDI